MDRLVLLLKVLGVRIHAVARKKAEVVLWPVFCWNFCSSLTCCLRWGISGRWVFKAMRGQRHSACGLLLWHGCMYPKGRARERLNTDAIRFGTHTAYIICIQEAHGLCQICSYHCCWDWPLHFAWAAVTRWGENVHCLQKTTSSGHHVMKSFNHGRRKDDNQIYIYIIYLNLRYLKDCTMFIVILLQCVTRCCKPCPSTYYEMSEFRTVLNPLRPKVPSHCCLSCLLHGCLVRSHTLLSLMWQASIKPTKSWRNGASMV